MWVQGTGVYRGRESRRQGGQSTDANWCGCEVLLLLLLCTVAPCEGEPLQSMQLQQHVRELSPLPLL